MKLVLAKNQSERFVSYYHELQTRAAEPFDYAGYDQLLFIFDPLSAQKIDVQHLGTGKNLRDYNGVYLNGYTNAYELATALATSCQALGIPFVDRELADAPSLSKLTEYAKLARAGVPIPRTIAGTKKALLAANLQPQFPQILKRADANRGIDNYKVGSLDQIAQLLSGHDDDSLWVLQSFIPNDGFWRVTFYGDDPAFSIFRAMGERADGNALKSHMYKPAGGANAALVDLTDVPAVIMDVAQQSIAATNRQMAGVDILQDLATGQPYVLEVNYNPQLVTVNTFQDIRAQAFLEGLGKIH